MSVVRDQTWNSTTAARHHLCNNQQTLHRKSSWAGSPRSGSTPCTGSGRACAWATTRRCCAASGAARPSAACSYWTPGSPAPRMWAPTSGGLVLNFLFGVSDHGLSRSLTFGHLESNLRKEWYLVLNRIRIHRIPYPLAFWKPPKKIVISSP